MLVDRSGEFLGYQLALASGMAILAAANALPLINFGETELHPKFFRFGIIAILGLTLVGLVRAYGFRMTIPTLANMYEVREEYSSQLDGAFPLAGYITMWVWKVIAPVAIILGLTKKQLTLASVGVGALFFSYVLSASKGSLGAAVMIVVLYLSIRTLKKHLFLGMLAGVVAIVIVGMLIDSLIGADVPYITIIFTRRVLFYPGLLTGHYFDYYSVYPKAMLSHSVLGDMFTASYSQAPPQIINYVYFGHSQGGANANFWADGFANFGIPGVLAASLILGSVLWLYNSVCSRKEFWLKTLIVGMPTVGLTNSAVLTVLLTHGLLLAIVVMWFSEDVDPERRTLSADPIR